MDRSGFKTTSKFGARLLSQFSDYKEWIFNCQAVKLMNTIQQTVRNITPWALILNKPAKSPAKITIEAISK
jgi:hypothetical protein